MIVTPNNNRLYLKNWEYNACRIISALATVVENNGGSVKPQTPAIISNLTLSTAIRDCSDKLTRSEAIQAEQPTERRANYIKEKRAELERMESINNDPVKVSHTTYISFVLENVHYYYQVSSNPFFEFYYSKTPVINNRISKDACIVEDTKEWLYDCFFSFSASDADIKEAANLICNMLVSAKCTPIRRDKTRRRVPNTYDGGYHYENVYAPERFETIGEWNK